MDSETPTGQIYMEWEAVVADTICQRKKCRQMLMSTPTSHSDRIFYREDDGDYPRILCIAEIKARNLSMSKLCGPPPYGDYIISNSKIISGAQLSELLVVPFIIFVKLIDSGEIVYWNITDKHGEIQMDIPHWVSETKDTCNGGVARRDNAHLPLSHMHTLTGGAT